MREPRSIPVPDRIWSDDEWSRIRRGFIPRDMDDKWSAFVEEGRLFLFRSWTGYQIFEAVFTPMDSGYRITSATAEGDRERYRPEDDEAACRALADTIRMILLREY